MAIVMRPLVLSAHSRVRWVGEYTSDQRIANYLKDPAVGSDGPIAMYNIAVFSRADLDDVATQILEASGGRLIAKIPLQSSYFNVVRVEMPTDAIDNVAAVEDIVAIDSYEMPVIEDERSSQIVAGNYTNATTISGPGYDPLAQFGVSGSNVTVAVVDDGVSIPGARRPLYHRFEYSEWSAARSHDGGIRRSWPP